MNNAGDPIIGEYKKIKNPYTGISVKDYNVEKRRLQIELLNIQQDVVKNKRKLCITFDGRDAAGKGSTILRFTENLMPQHYRVVALGIPTKNESKFWFRRYEKHLPKKGEVVFFDRSWYNRATIEPTMGYCSEKQYKSFMDKVLSWEHKLIADGLELMKFYLSVDKEHQLGRFQARLSDPLKFGSFRRTTFMRVNSGNPTQITRTRCLPIHLQKNPPGSTWMQIPRQKLGSTACSR